MFKERIPVRLIASDCQDLNVCLRKTLYRIGYKNISTCRTADIIESKINTSCQIFILPVISSFLPQNKRRGICEQLKEKPVLGITKKSDENLKDEYLATCHDFIYWPSTDNEFAFRMQRLCDVFNHSYYLSSDQDFGRLNPADCPPKEPPRA